MYQSLWSRCPSILNKPMLPWVLWQLMRRQTRAGNAIPQNVREWGTVPYSKNKERGSREIRDNRNLTHKQFFGREGIDDPTLCTCVEAIQVHLLHQFPCTIWLWIKTLIQYILWLLRQNR